VPADKAVGPIFSELAERILVPDQKSLDFRATAGHTSPDHSPGREWAIFRIRHGITKPKLKKLG